MHYRPTVEKYFSWIGRIAVSPHKNRAEKSENKLPDRGGFSPEMTSREKKTPGGGAPGGMGLGDVRGKRTAKERR